ncbi:hypothetical protein HYW53_00560 [Candidatus Giovannonibacteria bacterium]|nr:hypothetical protein [Candidatus Giovannonibacteria bacterium]
MRGSSKKEFFLISAGVFFIILSILFNQWTIARFFSFEGNLRIADKAILVLIDLIFILIGAYLIYRRKSINIEFKASNFLIFFASLIFILLLAEIGARVINYLHQGDFEENKNRAERQGKVYPFLVFGWDLYKEIDGVKFIVSRHGELYPLKKDPNIFRIVALGGSTTQDFTGGTHYPKLLEEKLQKKYPDKKIEVINAGNSGYSTPHMIILLTLDVISWDPDLVIASENVNDLTSAYYAGFNVDYSNKYGKDEFLPPRTRVNFDKIFGWSYFYWILKSRTEALSYHLKDLKGNVYKRKSYGMEPPKEAASIYKRNLRTLADVAKLHKIPIMFGTQPLEPSEEFWDLTMLFKQYNALAVYPLHEEFVLHHNAYNNIIEDVARETSSFIVDNDALFAKNRDYFADFVHYSKAGLEKLSDDYFNAIVKVGLIK